MEGVVMKRTIPAEKVKSKPATRAKKTPGAAVKHAAIFRNGSNQAVRLPQDFRFPDGMKEVRIRKQGDGLLLSPVRPNWASFFALEVAVPDEFMATRNDDPPQSREPL
jgi:antitoxin VapB